jgi:hypothetical protein
LPGFSGLAFSGTRRPGFSGRSFSGMGDLKKTVWAAGKLFWYLQREFLFLMREFSGWKLKQKGFFHSAGFDPSILRHSGILGAADESVLN